MLSRHQQAGGAATRLIMSSLAGPGGLGARGRRGTPPASLPRATPAWQPRCAFGAQARKVVSQKSSQLREAKQEEERGRRARERAAEERRLELEAVWNGQD